MTRINRFVLGLIAVAAFLGADSCLQAQGLRHSGGNAQIAESGRWHVQTTSGDQPAQEATGKPVEFDGSFECATTVCGGNPVLSHDSTVCDPIDFENIGAGFVINGTTGAFQFGVSGGLGDFFVYTFVGTLSEVHTVVRGVTSLESASITGTYGSTPGGCNNGLAAGQGEFVATWYPPMVGTFYGTLVPVEVTEPPFGVELVLTQAIGGKLTGTATTGRLLQIRSDVIFVPIQTACFASATLAIGQETSKAINGVSGNRFQVHGIDTAGNSLSLQGVATESGSNRRYSVQYEIVGGVCSGQSVNSASFRSVTESKGTDRPVFSPK